ncbi:MAG: DASS family sodium-coupled anion symporter [Desulfobacterales bacterium]|nr:DASS family sodium-coupled anion symporter [Desulfobacterales bacterium]
MNETKDTTGIAAFPSTNTFFGRFLENIRARGRAPAKTLIGFFVAWAVFFFILWIMPLPEGMSNAGKSTLAVLAWATLMWITEALPVGVTGLLIPMLLVMGGAVGKFPAAAGGFSQPVVFLTLAAFMLAAIMQTAGLDRRIALTLLKKMRVKEVGGIIWAMFGANLVLSFIIPAANARAATLLPVVNGITKLFGDTPEERAGKKAIVIQTLVYGSMISGMCIMTAHLPNLILVGLFETELAYHLSYFNWFLLQWPYLGMFVITQWWVRRYFKTRGVKIPGGIERVKEMHAELPKTSQTEWLIIAVFAFVGLMWMTESLHKIKAHNAALMGIALIFTPGLFGFKWKALQDRTIWGTWLLLAGAMSMSAAMGSSGLAKWLSDVIHPLATGHPWQVILLILMVGTHIMRLGMLSNVAAIAMLAPILIALAPKLGLHPVAFTMLVSDTDTFAYILPTQITAAVIAYSSGTFSMADYAKVGWVAVLIAIAYGILIMAPWYAFMGMPVWNPSAPWPF